MASESAPVEESGSLADHEAQYSAQARADAPVVEAPPVETPPAPPADTEPEPEPETSEPAIDGERDDKGRFVKGRHRAKSQQAGPEDVPRIAELTRRLRDTEAQLATLKASPPSNGNGHGAIAPPVASPHPAATPPPKPTPDQFTDYGEYVEALTDWKAEQTIQRFEAKRQQDAMQLAQSSKQQQLAQQWTARIADARKEFPDFDAVALQSDTKIPPGSLIDAWIIEHKSGPRVLYHLQQHPEEVTALLGLSLLDQADSLSLLSQRLTPTSRGSDATTGSLAAPVVPIAPRPPNPVRTGPLSRADDPPDPDKSSLAEHERFYQPRRARV